MNAPGEELSDDDFAVLASRVASLAGFAYLKDAQLRYDATSGDFAALLGEAAAQLAGKTDSAPFGDASHQARDEAERRCLVFGRPQKIVLTDSDGRRLTLALTRLRRSDRATFVIALDQNHALDELLAGLGAQPEREALPPKEKNEAPSEGYGVLPAGERLDDDDLAAVIEAMPMGVVVTGPDLTVEMVNGPFFDIWKVIRREDLVGMNFRALMDVNRHNGVYNVADEEWEDYVAQRLGEITAGRVAPREFARADGVVLMYSVTPLSAGKRMVCYYDVTEMREAKKALEHTAGLLNEASTAMAQGFMVFDAENIVFVNERFYEFLDVPREIVSVGKPWLSLVDYCARRGDYGDREEAESAAAYIRKSAETRVFYQLERRGGDGRWLRIDAKPTAGGLMVVTYSDISELKSREAELEALVARAEDSDRAKSEFLANMSHEIRTPMNGVLGMAELLSKSELDTRQRTYCDIIVKSGNALLTIINDILDFSKIEAGEITLDCAPFDLREAVEDVVGLMATGAAEKDLELAVRIAPDLPASFLGDVGRIRQILTNIVGNAVKFTERGHVFIAVSGAPAEDGAFALSIRIEDTGLGIPADKISTVFDKFSQADGSSTRRHEGTGLGLAITSRLVALMKGDITVESAPGAGSAFTVRLGLPVDKRKRASAVGVSGHAADLTGARVLVVDDNAINRDILIAQLSGWGCDACAATGGQEGLRVLQATAKMGLAVDCVVLDHQMPEMTGIEMARAIRAMEGGENLPIVLLTSVDVDPQADRLDELRLSAWLTKPAREALLRNTVGKAIGGSERPQAEEAAATSDEGAPNAPAGARLDSKRLVNSPEQADVQEDVDDDASLDLWVDSEGLAESVAGIGAALSFDDEEEKAHVDRELERRAKAGSPSPRDKRAARRLDILVAEDNEVNQIVFSQILDDLDVAYHIVENGALAVEEYQRAAPRLILMDVSMPVMNGHEATRTIRRIEAEADCHIPIIGVTAHALKGDREACMEAGMDDYICKPISPEMLEVRIRKWLGAHSGPIASSVG